MTLRSGAMLWSMATWLLAVSCDIPPGSIPTGIDLPVDPSPPSCDRLEIMSPPGPGLLVSTTTLTAEITGDQTGLGRVLSAYGVIVNGLNETPVEVVEYSLGEGGVVEVGTTDGEGGRFDVVDGCLGIRTGNEIPLLDASLAQLSEDLLALNPSVRGNCREGEVPLSQTGIDTVDGPHACVSAATSSCLICEQDEQGWVHTAVIEAEYRVSASINEVDAVDLVTGEFGRVDISVNDVVVVTISARTEYR